MIFKANQQNTQIPVSYQQASRGVGLSQHLVLEGLHAD